MKIINFFAFIGAINCRLYVSDLKRERFEKHTLIRMTSKCKQNEASSQLMSGLWSECSHWKEYSTKVVFPYFQKIDILCVAYENGIPTKRMFPLERILNKAEAAGDFNNYA